MKPAGEEIREKTDRVAEKPDSSLKAQALISITKWMPIVDKVLTTDGREMAVHILHRLGEKLSAARRNVDKSRVIPVPGIALAKPAWFSQVINKG